MWSASQYKDERLIYAVARDITPRKIFENKLRKTLEQLAIAKEKAEESDRLKSAFLASMSHELRTPLNSIIGFTGIIVQGLSGPINDEQLKQLTMVQNSSRHLLDLINDVLDLSKIEAKQLELRLSIFDVNNSVDSVVEVISPQADQKGLKIEVGVSSKIGHINSDKRRFEQILFNLINNAIKFTDKGIIKIEGNVTDDSFVTHVSDTGIGIKEEDMGKLFNTFQQIETGLSRAHDGTGLGLSICKKLVELLGGEIWAESKWNVGSIFSFKLPLRLEDK